jgi:inward rectifier potassium channel
MSRASRRASAARPATARPESLGTPPQARQFARGTADRVLAIGLPRPWTGDSYHWLLRLSWPRFLLGGVALYLATNALFALFYLAQPGAIARARPGAFADAFFFSVQTIATLGYGVMAPATFYANIVVTIETAVGLIFLAVATGLVFARFSRPTARVLFSRVAVVAPHNGVPTLSFRLANQRRNQILRAEVDVALLVDEATQEGETIRRFYDLKLARRHSPVFALTFTVMHPIVEHSPLYGATPASLAAQNAELVVTVTGLDETMAAAVNARTSYLADEIVWGHRFVDIMALTDDGHRIIDYRRFHDTAQLSASTGDR